MARDPDVLSDVQYEVLRLVADGAPPETLEDRGRRITARALDNKALVIVDGRGATWQIRITEGGLRALEAHALRVELPRKEVARLYAALAAADGLVATADFETPVPAHVLLAVSVESSARPLGRKLAHFTDYSAKGAPDSWRLVEYVRDSVALQPVPVPPTVKHYHPALAPFRTNRAATGLSVDEYARASRILHAIAIQAEARGYEVLEGATPDRHFRGRGANLIIVIRGNAHPVSIRRARDSEANGRSWLRVELPHGQYGREGAEWVFVDRAKRTLEERLPDLFRELEITQIQDEQRAAQRRIEDARRKEAQERAAAAAKIKRQYAHKVSELREQVARYKEAESIRQYTAHVRASRNSIGVDAQQWMVWADEYADTIDPACGDLKMPEDNV